MLLALQLNHTHLAFVRLLAHFRCNTHTNIIIRHAIVEVGDEQLGRLVATGPYGRGDSSEVVCVHVVLPFVWGLACTTLRLVEREAGVDGREREEGGREGDSDG